MRIKRPSVIGLRNQARKSLTARCHSRMNWQPVFEHNGGKGQNGICSRCHGTVQVLTKPQPNEIDIGGTALAQGCNELLQADHIPPGKTDAPPRTPRMSLVEIHYRLCNDGTVRAWRDHWFGDQFEVFTNTEWDQFRTAGERMTFRFTEHGDED